MKHSRSQAMNMDLGLTQFLLFWLTIYPGRSVSTPLYNINELKGLLGLGLV